MRDVLPQGEIGYVEALSQLLQEAIDLAQRRSELTATGYRRRVAELENRLVAWVLAKPSGCSDDLRRLHNHLCNHITEWFVFLHEPELLELGDIPLRLIGLGVVLDGIGLILMQALLGAGASAVVMRISVGLQWLLFLPLAWLVGPGLGNGLLAIWLAFISYRTLQTTAFVTLWRRRGWVGIKI